MGSHIPPRLTAGTWADHRQHRPDPPTDDAPWAAHGACRDADPELWFPRRYDSAAAKYAKGVCRDGCPVRAECLTYALNHDTPSTRHGIWGALDPHERRALKEATP